MEKERINDSVIFKFLNGTATAREAESVVQYLEENRDNRLNYFLTKRIWLESKEKSKEQGLIDSSWERLKLRIDEPDIDIIKERDTNLKFSWRKLAIAASISILVAISAFLGYQNYRNANLIASEQEVCAPMGSRSHLILPDGSGVWLNSGSKLTYGSDFSKKREVTLVGEAFFDVQHRKKTTFIVNTSDLRIRVLGTQFNVKSYPEEDIIETTLVKGKVEVEPIQKNASTAPILLAANQKLIYTKKKRSTDLDKVKNKSALERTENLQKIKTRNIQIVRNINTQEEYSWKDGKLTINSEPMEDLARKLERYYNVKISFQNDSIRKINFSGTLDQVTIEEVLRALESSSPIRFEIDKNQVILTLAKT